MFPPELYEVALQKEFDLAYHGRMGSIPDWQSVSVIERNWHHTKLVDVKNEEKKRNEEAQSKIRSQQSAKPARRR